MTVVAVAGGSGDLGRLIVDALLDTGKHEVYVLSRKAPENHQTRTSPLTGREYSPVIQTDYTEESLVEKLTSHNINVIICTIIMDSEAVTDAELRLIRAADKSPSVKRFIPSEFNVEYDVGDDIFPYPEKKFHLAARKELEKTSTLEYAYVYPGMFMDYFGMPKVPTNLRPLCMFFDPPNGVAVLPGDGEAKMSMTFTTDAARYIALALDLDKWPRILTTATSTITLNELVRLVEQNLGRKLDLSYQPIQKLLDHDPVDLPTNADIFKQFPTRFAEGWEQQRALLADLEAGVALGAFDFTKLQGEHLDLAKAFEEKVSEPKRIEALIEEAWKVDPVGS